MLERVLKSRRIRGARRRLKQANRRYEKALAGEDPRKITKAAREMFNAAEKAQSYNIITEENLEVIYNIFLGTLREHMKIANGIEGVIATCRYLKACLLYPRANNPRKNSDQKRRKD